MYKFNPKIRVLLIQFHPTMEKMMSFEIPKNYLY